MTRFKIITCQYNAADYLERCLQSILEQDYDPDLVEVMVVDDASTDHRGHDIITRVVLPQPNWDYIFHPANEGTLYSQVEGIRAMDPVASDVIVFLDGDDRFAHHGVLSRLDAIYREHRPLVTYGSYETDPFSPTCTPARAYPDQVVEQNAFRHSLTCFNHLRTVTGRVFNMLEDRDFTYADGTWFRAAGDEAVMLPCLELAGRRSLFIDEVMLTYTSDNPMSDWRVRSPEIHRAMHRVRQELSAYRPLPEFDVCEDQRDDYEAIERHVGERRVLVETGTALGEKMLWGCERFDRLATVELDFDLHQSAVQRIKAACPVRILEGSVDGPLAAGVTAIHGDSATAIGDLADVVDQAAVWFLDAHAVEPDEHDELSTPLMTELDALTKRTYDDVVLVDDARLLGLHGWPTLDEVTRFVSDRGWHAHLEDDILVVTRA